MRHYLDGKWVDEAAARISVFDLSVLRGFGIFDFLRTYARRPFRLKEHVDRLFNSAKLTGIKMRWGKKEIEKIVVQGVKKNTNEAKDFTIRIIVTGGVSADSTVPGRPSLIVMYVPAVDYPLKNYEEGVRVITYPAKRVLAHAKTLNYLTGIMALQEARSEKAIEAIYVDESGLLYEGTMSNLFVVKKGKILTPHIEILAGITRGVIVELTKKLKIHLEEKNIYRGDLPSINEAFITASNKEVMPVVVIDGRKIGTGAVGPVTQRLLTAYRQLTRQK
ncbi:aminotransferase class IV [Candidatus Roizmanbacteria bacterium]|nr:aminotransferase class IV [Candidatus Roizmanbacteria bacterium]